MRHSHGHFGDVFPRQRLHYYSIVVLTTKPSNFIHRKTQNNTHKTNGTTQSVKSLFSDVPTGVLPQRWCVARACTYAVVGLRSSRLSRSLMRRWNPRGLLQRRMRTAQWSCLEYDRMPRARRSGAISIKEAQPDNDVCDRYTGSMTTWQKSL